MWISAPVRSEYHKLPVEAFRLLRHPDSHIQVGDVGQKRFLLSVLAVDAPADEALAALQGHKSMGAFLVALNVATLGMFHFAEEPWVHPLVHVSEELGGPSHPGVLVTTPRRIDAPDRTLEEREVENALIIFPVLARETDWVLLSEYLRGLLLLRMQCVDLSFRREAFACFYRALENFAAARILKVRKLKNELRDLKRAISSVGMSEKALTELDTVYKVRSSQVAHSQIMPRDVDLDEVMKTKTFLDFVMFKTFKAQGVKILEAHSESTAASGS